MRIRNPAALVLALCMAGPAAAQSAPARAPAILIHGNYCGPGNNAPLPPIDALDAACARHDACTPDGRPGTKACNLRLLHEAEGVAQDPSQPEELRSLAGLVATGAALMPSAPAVASAPAGPSDAVSTGSIAPRAGFVAHPELLADTPVEVEPAPDE